MQLEYKISEEDYLTYQLYASSKNPSISRRRKTVWLLIPLLYIAFGVLAYFNDQKLNLAIIFGSLGLLWLIAYPFYSRWMYRSRYKKHIKQNNSEMFNRPVSLSIREDMMIIQDDKNQSKVHISEVRSINEIKSHLFLRLKTGSALIVPKHQLKDLKPLAKLISEISKASKINITKELNWKWK